MKASAPYKRGAFDALTKIGMDWRTGAKVVMEVAEEIPTILRALRTPSTTSNIKRSRRRRRRKF